MSDNINPLSPEQTMNMGSPDHLTQIKHKGSRVDIVDHPDHGALGGDAHIITAVKRYVQDSTVMSQFTFAQVSLSS